MAKKAEKRHCEYVYCNKLYEPKTSKSRFCDNKCRSAQWKLDNIISNKQIIERFKSIENRLKTLEELHPSGEKYELKVIQ